MLAQLNFHIMLVDDILEQHWCLRLQQSGTVKHYDRDYCLNFLWIGTAVVAHSVKVPLIVLTPMMSKITQIHKKQFRGDKIIIICIRTEKI
jgi:hypothetical protein